MKKTKRTLVFVILLLILLLIAGCQKESDIEKGKKGPFLFYVDAEGDGLYREHYQMKEDDPMVVIQDMLDRLRKAPKHINIESAFPKDVKVQSFTLENGVLELTMNAAYQKMEAVEEVLLRAALVQSLIQIPGVNLIEMNIEGAPLLMHNGKEVGPMDRDSFVKDTGTALKSYQHTSLTLFFANEKGDGLRSEKVDVRYLGNTSTEKLVVERLMKGPETEGLKPILSPEVRLLSASVKEGICYLNFDEHFLKAVYDVKPEVVIYGIVNSLISNGTVNRVQILVEGESMLKFQEQISLQDPFERNSELVE